MANMIPLFTLIKDFFRFAGDYRNNNDNTRILTFIKTEVKGDCIDLPIFRGKESLTELNNYRSFVTSVLRTNNITSCTDVKTSIGKKILTFICNPPHGETNKVIKIKTKNNTIYYVGHGVLFDKDMNLLLLSTVTINVSTSSIKKLTYRISPKLLAENSPLSKIIIKDVIPTLPQFSSNYFITDLSEPFTLDPESYANVSVEDLNRLVYRPVEGQPEEVNKFLSDNSGFITAQLGEM